jgi:integrase
VPILSLTDLTIRSLKPTPEQVTYWDKGLKNFGLRVSPGGTMTWTLLLGQERQRVKLGNYPIIGLKDARELARHYLAQRTLGQHKQRSETFSEALATFDATHLKSKRATTSYELRRLLKRHFVPKLGRKQLRDLEAHHITDITDTLSPGTAWHAFAAVQTFLNWAVRRRFLSASPIAGVPSPPKSAGRSRVLSNAELKAVWTAADRLGTFGDIVKLLLATGQRRGEIASLQISSIDLENKTITLPREITKNGREHTFPIGPLAASFFSTTSQQFIFPARGKSSKTFNGWSKSKAALDKICGVTNWTLHDLRRTFATRLAELGISPHIIERLLNHVTGQISGVAAIYNRASYLPEMRAAIALWDTYLQHQTSLGRRRSPTK